MCSGQFTDALKLHVDEAGTVRRGSGKGLTQVVFSRKRT